ncbi:GDSL-type esterase/lipase family protein [Mucilaginibacter arboris]|uniref:GDSL-type esterase/lipase family protein n=1 Tax=Mucilaginibacter arboris TaxID=2682090 RepID=UPI0018DD7394|nr:GDSL-type esterase/lipase family protein [Mucilaginibacter arboris]
MLLFLAFFTSAIVYAQSPSCSLSSKLYAKDSIDITTFGASTVAGINGLQFQGYLNSDFQACYPGKTIIVDNYGIPSQTTTQGLARFEATIKNKTGFVLILMGLNDALAIVDGKMKIAETQSNMDKMIEIALAYNLIPVIGTIQYLNDTNNKRNQNANFVIRQINAIYRRIATNRKIYFTDINAVLGRDWSLYQDTTHPNAQGNMRIAYAWFDTLNMIIENKLLLSGLSQNYPNPSVNNTTIGFSLAKSNKVIITLYNMAGAIVKTLANNYFNSGYHEIVLPTTDLVPGIYLYAMQTPTEQYVKKMVVLGR